MAYVEPSHDATLRATRPREHHERENGPADPSRIAGPFSSETHYSRMVAPKRLPASAAPASFASLASAAVRV